MGIHKITVAGWESKRPISPQHDLILRAMVVAKLAGSTTPALAALERVHTDVARSSARRIVIESL